MVLHHEEYDTEFGVFHKPLQCSHLYFQFMEGSNITGNLTWGWHAGDQLQANWTPALRDARTASNNFIFGDYAGQRLSTGVGNMLYGMYAGNALTTGSDNIFFGHNIMNTVGGTVLDAPGVRCTTGSRNIGLGTGSLQLLVTGSDNVAFGHNAGAFAAAASSNSLYAGANAGNRAGWTGDYLLCVAAETEAGYAATSELIQGAFTGGTLPALLMTGGIARVGPTLNVNGILRQFDRFVPMTVVFQVNDAPAVAIAQEIIPVHPDGASRVAILNVKCLVAAATTTVAATITDTTPTTLVTCAVGTDVGDALKITGGAGIVPAATGTVGGDGLAVRFNSAGSGAGICVYAVEYCYVPATATGHELVF